MPVTTSKIGPVSTNPNIGTVQAPSPTIAGAEVAAEIYTFFLKPSDDGTSTIIYNADRQYARVTLTLETAGPVAVSTKQQVIPVLSGKGIQLTTNEQFIFEISKGNRLWAASTALSRIKVMVQPIPWGEQITGLIWRIIGGRK